MVDSFIKSLIIHNMQRDVLVYHPPPLSQNIRVTCYKHNQISIPDQSFRVHIFHIYKNKHAQYNISQNSPTHTHYHILDPIFWAFFLAHCMNNLNSSAHAPGARSSALRFTHFPYTLASCEHDARSLGNIFIRERAFCTDWRTVILSESLLAFF